jgi:hypothetical protein
MESDANQEVKQKMLNLLAESRSYLRAISGGRLPDHCLHQQEKTKAFLLRQAAKADGSPKYPAYDYRPGTYA